MGGSNAYVHYFDGGDVSQMYTYVKMYQIIHLKYVQFTQAERLLNDFNSVLKFLKKTQGVFKSRSETYKEQGEEGLILPRFRTLTKP